MRVDTCQAAVRAQKTSKLPKMSTFRFFRLSILKAAAHACFESSFELDLFLALRMSVGFEVMLLYAIT